MWKWLLSIVLVLVVIFAGLGWVVTQSGVQEKLRQQFNPKLKPVEVKFGEVSRGSIVRLINAPGELEPLRKVEISAQVSARIIELPFRENEHVKKDDVVVKLDDRDLAALVDSARAQLRSEEARLDGARASVTNAEVELTRRQRLAASGDLPQSEADAARLEYERAVSNLRMVEEAIAVARANIVRAEKDLDNTIIKAPFDGIITKLNAEVGETVVVGTLNNPGSVILEIADLDVMLVKARVDEANVARVKEGQKTSISLNAYPDVKLSGTVQKVGLKRLTDTNGTRYFETEVLIERPKDMMLRTGLTANIDVQVETYADVLKVPTQAVLDRAIDDLPDRITRDNPVIEPDKRFTRVVFVAREEKAVPVPVRVGASDATHSMVLAGLAEGDRIIIGPFKALSKMEQDQAVVEEGTKKKDEQESKLASADQRDKPKPPPGHTPPPSPPR